MFPGLPATAVQSAQGPLSTPGRGTARPLTPEAVGSLGSIPSTPLRTPRPREGAPTSSIPTSHHVAEFSDIRFCHHRNGHSATAGQQEMGGAQSRSPHLPASSSLPASLHLPLRAAQTTGANCAPAGAIIQASGSMRLCTLMKQLPQASPKPEPVLLEKSQPSGKLEGRGVERGRGRG